MAEQLKNFQMRTTKKGKSVQYPYDLWFNGNYWKIKQGVDYFNTTLSMQALLYKWIKLSPKYCRVRCQIIDDKTIVFQAYEER